MTGEKDFIGVNGDCVKVLLSGVSDKFKVVMLFCCCSHLGWCWPGCCYSVIEQKKKPAVKLVKIFYILLTLFVSLL